jgi:hypothetical protein
MYVESWIIVKIRCWLTFCSIKLRPCGHLPWRGRWRYWSIVLLVILIKREVHTWVPTDSMRWLFGMIGSWSASFPHFCAVRPAIYCLLEISMPMVIRAWSQWVQKLLSFTKGLTRSYQKVFILKPVKLVAIVTTTYYQTFVEKWVINIKYLLSFII